MMTFLKVIRGDLPWLLGHTALLFRLEKTSLFFNRTKYNKNNRLVTGTAKKTKQKKAMKFV